MSQQNTWNLDYSTYNNLEAEKAKDQASDELIQRAQERGRQDAEVGLPQKKGVAQSNFIRTTVQDLINTLRGLHRADEHIDNSVSKQERILHEARIERDNARVTLKRVMAEFKLMQDDFPKGMAYVVTLLTLVAGVVEGLMSRDAVRTIIPNYFTSLFVSLFLGVLLTILAHQIVKWWFLGKNRFQKFLIRTGIVVGTSAFFSVMGMMRSAQRRIQSLAIDEQGCNGLLCNVDKTDALIFMFFSLGLFLPACLLAKFAPTKEQWMGLFRARGKQLEVRKHEKLLNVQLKKVAEAEDQMDELKQYSYSKAQYAIRLEEDCTTLAETAWEEYVQSNLRHRRDKVHPDCFDKSFEPRLKTYFYKQNSTPSKSKKS